MKRDRDAAYGPPTPKGDGDDSKVLGGLTPLAKKGRVQDGPVEKNGSAHEALSDEDSLPGEEEEDDSVARAGSSQLTPPRPPPGLETTSAPDTPILTNARLPAKSEGRDTRSIRRRVEALEWDDQQGPPPDDIVAGASIDQDTEIAEVAAEVSQSAAKVDENLAKDVEIADVADEVSQSAAKLADADQADQAVADVAAEVGETAAEIDKKDEENVEIADVAAEVGETASQIDAEEEETSKVVAQSPLGTTDANTVEEKASGDATSSPDTIKTFQPAHASTSTPAKPSSSFSAFSSTASPFSTFSSTASPFSAVPSKPVPTPPAAEEQKPKSKATFSAPLATTSPDTPGPSRIGPLSATSTPKPAASVPPSTPFGKLATPATSAPPASPFGAFSSTSGFASVSSKSGSGFGSYSAATASPFASIQKKSPQDTEEKEKEDVEEGVASRKLGEPVEADEEKRVFKEQELITGEEDDDTVHSVKCKLYVIPNFGVVCQGAG
ncbi:hypothetical protein T439DRAFT_24029 [Meredithblackwellia eburnea MCA 4105]